MVASPRRIGFGLHATDRRGPLCESGAHRKADHVIPTHNPHTRALKSSKIPWARSTVATWRSPTLGVAVGRAGLGWPAAKRGALYRTGFELLTKLSSGGARKQKTEKR